MNRLARRNNDEDGDDDYDDYDSDDEYDDAEDVENAQPEELNAMTRALILALGVCYHACLQKREEYRQYIAPRFVAPMTLTRGAETIAENISWCQDVFLDEIEPGENIAKNQALKENVFMMIVCIELRIPLFLVGKPGSSKSLAKTIVADAMQGEAAKSELFRSLKSIHMVSYQCSPLSTAEGIVGTFRQCAQLQENQNLDKFVSIVVLDEVGLAEDSDRMPLKALHPLLEDGCEGDEKPAPHKKVGFIGISNWALDPAKMNRGILVQRGVPDEQELEQSARGICSGNRVISTHIGNLLEPMAKAYLELYNSALEIREFFGLRDFYSLVKMVYGFAARSRDVPTWYELQHAILRNFGGLDGIAPVEVFDKHLPLIKKDAARKDSDPACDPASLIRASLHGDNVDSESRYLLLLTENYAALGILQNELLNIDNAIIIFGSSFPRDQEYTQVCRNINRIKICMETGRTVVLLNLENLYESLYDALNQYYVTFGDQRFVDLGLGTQRVKCRVDKKFRLIVVAEKQVVYHKFPIPLINRLEKHFLAMTTMLTTDQLLVVEKLTCWCKEFSGCNIGHVTGFSKEKLKIGDVFIGYHDDAPASVILDVCQRQTRARIWSSESGGEENVRRGEGDTAEAADRRDLLDYNKVLEEAKDIMLCCATPESLVRLSGTSLARDQPQLYKRYTVQQKHSSVHEFLHHVLVEQRPKHSVFVQLTTHSRLLQRQDVKDISGRLQVRSRQVSLQNLHAFGTEQQFCRMLRDFMLGEDRNSSKATVTVATATPSSASSVRLLLLQCDSGDTSADLIACARYNIWNEYTQLVARGNEELGAVTSDVIIHVVLVVQLPRIAGGCFVGFQGGKWTSYHIDDLHPDPDKLPPLIALSDLSISSLFERALMRGRDASTPEQAQRVEQPMEESMGFTSEQHLGDSILPGKPDRDEGEMDVSPWEILVNPTEEMLVNPTEQMLVNPTEQMLVNPTEEIFNMDTEMGSASTVLEDSTVDTQLELDVSQIIRNCIHGAVAMIKDPPSVAQISRNRKTQRLTILLQLTRDDQSLMAVLKKRVSLLLKDKEQTAMNSELAKSWLRNDAASFKSICKAGTFRRSMWQCLESRVTPLLAGLIAYFASNSNLELLSTGIPDPKDRDDTMESTAWIERMWFNMIMDSDVTSIAYRDLQTAMQKGELTDFEIKSTGRGGFQFAAKLPFSWVIKSRVDAAVQKAKQQPQYPQLEAEDPEELTERLLAKRPLGRILNVAYAESGAKERVVSCYLHDFVCMIYTPQSKYHAEELKLIADDLMNSARRRVTEESYGRQDTVDTTARDQCVTIPGIHLTYDAIHSRIELFSQLAQEFSECVLTLFKSKAIADSPLDLRALIMLLETMSPQKDTLNDENERRKWRERVSHFTPLVSRLLESVSISCLQGQDMKHQDTCRFTWNKIRALQMFIEHVCVRGSDDQRASVQRCMPLWTFLGDTVDFKKVTSLEKLEKFLTVYNSNVVEKYFGKMDKCSGCEESAGEPIELPCRHIVCRPCLLEMKEVEMLNCPRQGCNGAFQADMKFEIIAAKRQQVKLYSLYKNRINTFYMDLVSRLCFSGDTPPESQVIKKLMGYVTRSAKLQDKLKSAGIQTRARAKSHVIKKLVMFDEGFDPTPVVRSFFLQLLLRSSFEEVKEYLEDYLDSARHLIHSNPQHIMELCALCIQCLEDYHHGQGVQSESDRDILQSVSRMLLDAGRMNMDTGITMLKLEWVGRVRYCLSVTADWIYRFYLDEGEPKRWRHLEIEVRTLCDRAAALCDGNLKWPRLYLMKLLVRRYGMDVLHKVKLEPVIKWLLPREALQTAENDRLPDRFVVLGDEYKALRELIAKIVLGEDCSALEGQLKTLKIEAGKTERLLLLALFREVTSTYGYQDISRRPNKETEKKLLEFCDATPFITNKALAKKLMTNHQDADWLRVIPHREAVDLGLAEVIIHLKMIIEGVTGKTSLYKPYTNIILEPRSMGKSYLPTMPQDELGEVREAVLQARNAAENPVFYQCPNGHPYVIGNCGRPATHGACNQCGLPIGGGGYQLLPGNTQIADNKADNTAPGHILGTARAWTSVPERGLSPASVAVLRILLHMSMYLGAVDHNQEISKVIVPRVADDQVKNFLWQHIRADLEAAAKAIGRSRDDVMILLHQLIDRSATTPQPAVTGLDDKLRSKQARQTWETSFATNNIIALVQGLNERLQTANNKIVNDDRLGSNPVMRLLYEVDGGGSVQQGPGVEVEDMVAVWRYRSRVSLEHMSQELHESSARCGKKELPHPVLRSFLRRVQELKALRLLPSVVRLHQLLLHKLNRRIHIAEATSTTLGTFLLSEGKTDEHNREELENLVRQFSTTWSYIRKHLAGYAFKGQQLLEEHAPEEIGTDTRLAVLLPSLRGWGLCSVALVFYLTQLQNDFMEEYSKLTKQKLETIVSVQDANLSHLIAFHEEKDIQPIILANCNYSLEMGCGTKVEYDFAEMEAQIVERFIRGRPRLDFQMDFIAFREDFTNAAVFLQLRALIPQIALPNAHDVESALQQKLPEVNDLLTSLDIVIGFLVSVGGEADSLLVRFMADTLKMKSTSLLSVIDKCQLKHVEALWMLLSFIRARVQVNNGQEAFEGVDQKYRERLPVEARKRLCLGLQHVNMDVFLPLLYECIVMRLTVKQDVDQEDYIDNADQKLKDAMFTYLVDERDMDIELLPILADDRFPAEISVRHCIDTWKVALHPKRRHDS